MSGTVESLTADTCTLLAKLVAFDTTSRESNLDLIGFVESELSRLGVTGTRVASRDGSKANLYATLGPNIEGGIVLSGHTDVVPVDGQAWTSDPFALTLRDDRLYGRGTCDMKGFIALALAAAPLFLRDGAARPVHLALSYDEEVGCLGAPAMIREIAAHLPPIQAVIVGEPTNMEVVSGHKGICTYTVTVIGHEGHSSLPALGLSANRVAVRLMATLLDIADQLERQVHEGSRFQPPYPTLTIGQVAGGTAVNILAGRCSFSFDLRCPPGVDPDVVLAPFMEQVALADAAARGRFAKAGVTIVRHVATPPLAPEPDGAAERLARRLAGDNGPARAVSYAAEAGQFQEAGFSTIVCGPGSIEQAHQPDEYVELAQIERGAGFMLRLADALR